MSEMKPNSTWPLTDYTDYIDKVRKSYHTDYIDKVHHQYVSFDALHAYLFVRMPCHTAYIDKI